MNQPHSRRAMLGSSPSGYSTIKGRWSLFTISSSARFITDQNPAKAGRNGALLVPGADCFMEGGLTPKSMPREEIMERRCTPTSTPARTRPGRRDDTSPNSPNLISRLLVHPQQGLPWRDGCSAKTPARATKSHPASRMAGTTSDGQCIYIIKMRRINKTPPPNNPMRAILAGSGTTATRNPMVPDSKYVAPLMLSS